MSKGNEMFLDLVLKDHSAGLQPEYANIPIPTPEFSDMPCPFLPSTLNTGESEHIKEL